MPRRIVVDRETASLLSLDPARTALLVIDVQLAFDLWEAAGQRRNNPNAAKRIADLLTAS